MTAQVTIRGQLYLVQVLLEDKNGVYHWENVDTTKSQGKARQFMEYLQNNDFNKVADIYKSEYYQTKFLGY